MRKFLMWLLIPKNTDYCYDKNGLCPYTNYSYRNYCYDKNGSCPFFSKARRLENSSKEILGDQCKVCGKKLYNGK